MRQAVCEEDCAGSRASTTEEATAEGSTFTEEATTAEEFTAAVRAARQGGEQAFRVLYRSLTPELLRYTSVIVGEDAEDVVAEVWLQIARDVTRFDGDGPAFRRFTLTVARNRARDLLRRRKRRAPEIPVPLGELPEPRDPSGWGARDTARVAGERLSGQETLALVAALPRPQAEAVMLRVVLDLDTKSAAQILGKRPGAVAMALSRGLKRLAQWVERPETAEAIQK